MTEEEALKLKEVFLNYYIVVDDKKERSINKTKHIYDEMLVDALPALMYCLHLPRSGIDTVIKNPSVITSRTDLHHNIFIISSYPSEDIFEHYPPTLFICEDTCYAEAYKLSVDHSAYLGCIKFSSLSPKLIEEHWGEITQKVINLGEKGEYRRLNVVPQLFSEDEKSLLPIVFLTNETNDTKEVLNILRKNKHDFKLRAIITQRQLANLTVLDKFLSQGKELNEEMLVEVELQQAVQGFPLVITLPGTPRRGTAFGIRRRLSSLSLDEKSLINFLGLQRAVAIGGVWLEGNVLPTSFFRQLHMLEEHFSAEYQNSKFIWGTLRKIGKEITYHFEVDQFENYMSGSSGITAFTDFPIGLAILPGFSDPICSLLPISYRPLTPLTSAFKYGLNRPPIHYIGTGKGFNILILECLSPTEKIRPASNWGWEKIRKTFETSDLVNVQYLEVYTIERMEEVLNTISNIDVLVISAHGSYIGKEIAGLKIGDETRVWLPIKGSYVPPVVILSACHVASKGRGAFTVSDAFINCGALAVLGTLIPVSVTHNAEFTIRFFQYIQGILESENWGESLAQVLPRVISMNAVFEIINSTKKLKKWAYIKRSNGKSPIEEYFERWQYEFGNNHRNTVSILKEIVKGTEMEEYLESVLQSQGYYSESFFYIFSGYPENVIISDSNIKQMIEDKFIEM